MFDLITEFTDGLIAEMVEHQNDGKIYERRAFRTFYVSKDKKYLAIPIECNGQARYYAGFEYVDEENVMTCGGYVFYSADDERIHRIIDSLNDNIEDDEIEE